MHSITIRLKLTEFIDTDLEEGVIDKINEVYKIHQFKLHFWYEEGELQPNQLKEFVKKSASEEGDKTPSSVLEKGTGEMRFFIYKYFFGDNYASRMAREP